MVLPFSIIAFILLGLGFLGYGAYRVLTRTSSNENSRQIIRSIGREKRALLNRRNDLEAQRQQTDNEIRHIDNYND